MTKQTTWDDVENGRDLHTGPQEEISKAYPQPRIGLRFDHPTLGNVIVIAVHPLGTIDVRNIWTGRCYRITGLPMENQNPLAD